MDVLYAGPDSKSAKKGFLSHVEEGGTNLAGKLLVDRRERVELVLEVGGVLLVEEAAYTKHSGSAMRRQAAHDDAGARLTP